ncbi:MAG: ATP-binding cassette domain-containing protein [Alphaproteobacteria bacterium]|nr:ATP-binding cassette domain-containing protein [Alphaproteobacteria bacterium]
MTGAAKKAAQEPQGDFLLEAREVARVLEGDVPVHLVRGVSLTVKAGDFLAITGPSGSGKSSLLYLLGLLDTPSTGEVFIGGRDASMLNDDARARVRLENLGFIFQFHFLLPEFTALENVMMPMRRLGRLSDREIKARAEKLLTDLGLGDQVKKLPRQMSGGQAQRVAIARALANDPMLILADEPTGNLDTASSRNVQMILKDIAAQGNRAVVAVTHETDFAEKAGRRIHLVDGRIAENA